MDSRKDSMPKMGKGNASMTGKKGGMGAKKGPGHRVNHGPGTAPKGKGSGKTPHAKKMG